MTQAKGQWLLIASRREDGDHDVLVLQANGKTVERWANQTDSGQNKLAPGENRAKDRSRTYQGIANAWASQWGGEGIQDVTGRRESVRPKKQSTIFDIL